VDFRATAWPNPIGNRTRDLPAYSAVPQPETPPRNPEVLVNGVLMGNASLVMLEMI